MKIGLIDVDSKMANLALMKISAWHKAQGDEVDWFKGNQGSVERIYASRIFNFSPDFPWHIFEGFPVEIIRGGTGYDIRSKLPPEMEVMPPDYSIYPDCDYGVGFMTRGCINKCEWCVVPEKEGELRDNSPWWGIWRPDYRKILFLDNNALASWFAIKELENLIEVNKARGRGKTIMIDFNQGLDARLIDAALSSCVLSKLHWIRFIRLACDSQAMIEPVKHAIMNIRTAMPGREIFIYLLVRDVDEAEARMHEFDGCKGLTFFAQPFRDPRNPAQQPTEEQMNFARFVNVKGSKLCMKMKFKEYKRT
ncbi:MAG: hypothetical protein WCV67_02965 [Victivallaceae bacterium]